MTDKPLTLFRFQKLAYAAGVKTIYFTVSPEFMIVLRGVTAEVRRVISTLTDDEFEESCMDALRAFTKAMAVVQKSGGAA